MFWSPVARARSDPPGGWGGGACHGRLSRPARPPVTPQRQGSRAPRGETASPPAIERPGPVSRRVTADRTVRPGTANTLAGSCPATARCSVTEARSDRRVSGQPGARVRPAWGIRGADNGIRTRERRCGGHLAFPLEPAAASGFPHAGACVTVQTLTLSKPTAATSCRALPPSWPWQCVRMTARRPLRRPAGPSLSAFVSRCNPRNRRP